MASVAARMYAGQTLPALLQQYQRAAAEMVQEQQQDLFSAMSQDSFFGPDIMTIRAPSLSSSTSYARRPIEAVATVKIEFSHRDMFAAATALDETVSVMLKKFQLHLQPPDYAFLDAGKDFFVA